MSTHSFFKTGKLLSLILLGLTFTLNSSFAFSSEERSKYVKMCVRLDRVVDPQIYLKVVAAPPDGFEWFFTNYWYKGLQRGGCWDFLRIDSIRLLSADPSNAWFVVRI